MNGENSEGDTGLSESGTGVQVDLATGIMTITPSGKGPIQCHLEAGKTVAACTQTPETGESALMIMTRKGVSYSPSDLTGIWHINALATPGTYWDRGSVTIDAGGGFAVIGNDSNGEINGETGTMSVDPQGVLALQIDNFNGAPINGAAPLSVNFTDETTHNPTSWLWDFGDGTTSTLQNPSHLYTSPGVYTASLTATGPGGPVSITEDNYIYVSNGIGTFNLPDTGQAQCYNTAGAEITCNGTGQDGAYIINPMSYSDNGDGTVTDNNTGLMWQKEDNGDGYNWYEASGKPHVTHNPTSLNICGSLVLGGYSDWRLPARMELMSIVDYGLPISGPTISSAYFPNTRPYDYWTSVPDAEQPAKAWCVSFNSGGVGKSDKDFSYGYVRCVRGGQMNLGNLIDNHDGTVTDNMSGMVWQQGEPGRMTWQTALNYCESLDLANRSDWRLPNFKELESIVDDSRSHLAINTLYFPNAQGSEPFASSYWSSTSYFMTQGGAWAVDFHDGSFYGIGKTGNPYVRCVSGGGAWPLMPVWILGTANYFTTLQGAQDAADGGNTIEAQATDFLESLTVTKSLTVIGGFDTGYAMNGGYSTLQGLTIRDGSLTVERLAIK